MDYTYYILAVLVIGLACFGVIRLVTRDRGSAVLLDYEKSRRRADKRRWHARPDDLQVTATSGRSARASSRQPVRPGLNASLRSWTDRAGEPHPVEGRPATLGLVSPGKKGRRWR